MIELVQLNDEFSSESKGQHYADTPTKCSIELTITAVGQLDRNSKQVEEFDFLTQLVTKGSHLNRLETSESKCLFI